MARSTRRLTVVALLLAGGIGLAACSSGDAAATQACQYVAKAAQLEAQSTHASGVRAHQLASQATVQLEDAEPLAAEAAASDGSWQGLQATLGEVDHVPTAQMIPTLRADCAKN